MSELTGAILNEVGVLMHEVNRWRDEHPGYTPQQEISAVSPSKLWYRAEAVETIETRSLYREFMLAIGYLIPKEKP